MIDHQHVNQWLQDYISAWKSYDPQAISALFSPDASYRYSPYSQPLRGRQAIVDSWLENRDPPGTYSASYQAIAVDGSTAVSNGRSQYYEADGKTPKQEYDNLFVMRFDEEGRCSDFCEWYVKQPKRGE